MSWWWRASILCEAFTSSQVHVEILGCNTLKASENPFESSTLREVPAWVYTCNSDDSSFCSTTKLAICRFWTATCSLAKSLNTIGTLLGLSGEDLITMSCTTGRSLRSKKNGGTWVAPIKMADNKNGNWGYSPEAKLELWLGHIGAPLCNTHPTTKKYRSWANCSNLTAGSSPEVLE